MAGGSQGGSDLQLIWGVKGGASLSGATGSEIRRQLSDLVKNLNDDAEVKKRSIKFSLNVAGTRKNLADGMRQVTKELGEQKQFKIKLSKIDASAAIKDFQSKIQGVLNTLQIKNGMTVSVTDFTSGGKITGDPSGAKNLAEATQRAREYAVQLSTVKDLVSTLSASQRSLVKIDGADPAQITDLTQRIEALKLRIEEFKGAKNTPNQALVDEITRETAAINQEVVALRNATRAQQENGAAEADANATRERSEQELSSLNSLLQQVQHAHDTWTKAASDPRMRSEYEKLAPLIERIRGAIAGTNNESLAALRSEFKSAETAIKGMGGATQSLSSRLGGLAAKFSTWFSLTRVIMAAFRAVKKMVTSVVELDSAMTQLKIVTGASDVQMTKFLSSSTALAKELGKSITDVLKSVETFSRLGYNLDESSILAKYTAILSNVAGVSTEDATTGVTSIIKGFNMDVSNSEHVADVLIEVGQKYAVSAGELMEAFERSGAALHATNTSFEKSAGLIAAANASVQDASTVGTALKTVSARIRGSKSDLDALGESTEDLANGFSKYADEIKALTGFDIMVDGTTDQFKDIYDIFDGLAGVWDKLSDTQQARVAEILGGTRQLQVISSILGNWSDAAGAYADAMDSAGVATQAEATYMDSIKGHVAQLQVAFQELSQTLIDSDFLEQFVDLSTWLLGVLNGVAKLIDAIGGLNVVLTATLGIIAVIKIDSIITSISRVSNGVVGFITGFSKLKGVMAAYNTVQGPFISGTQRMNAALGAVGISASAAQIAIGTLVATLTIAIAAYSKYRQAKEEQRQAMEDAAKTADEERATIQKLSDEYRRLASADVVDESSRERIKQIQQEITDLVGDQADNLDLVNGKLDDQIDKLDEISYKNAKENANALETKLVSSTDEYSSAGDDAFAGYSGGGVSPGAIQQALNYLKENGKQEALSRLGHSELLDNVLFNYNVAGKGTFNFMNALKGKDAKEVLDIYREIQDALLKTRDLYDGQIEYFDASEMLAGVQQSVDYYESLVDTYKQDQKNFFKNQAIIDMFDYTKSHDVNTQEQFNAYISSIRESKEYSGEYKQVLLDLAANAFPEFAAGAGLATDAVDEFSNKLIEPGTLSSASGVVEAISKAESEIQKIGKVLGEFSQSGAVGASTLDTLRETFGDCESFQNFVNVMSDSASTTEQAQAASNALAKEWINTRGILSLVNEETAESVEALLELAGVTNAHEVVEAQLNNVRAQAWLATNNLTNATADEIAAKLTDVGATDELRRAVLNHKFATEAAKIETGKYNGTLTEQIGVLVAVANAAGIATKSLAGLSKAQALEKRFEAGKASFYEVEHYDELMAGYAREAQAEFTKLLNPEVPINISVPTITSGSSGSGKDKSDTKSSSKEVEKYIADIDRLRIKKEMLRREELNTSRISDQIARTDDSIDGIKERIRLTGDLIAGYEEEQKKLHELAGDNKGTAEDPIYERDTRRAEILEKINEFEQKYGIQVQYNAETNELMCEDLEAINDLTEDRSKAYATEADRQEAQNKRIKEAEELYGQIVDLNDENIECSAQWEENAGKIHEEYQKIVDDLKQIVEVASSVVDEVQNVYDTLQQAADEYAANDGFISVDTFQEITAAGLEYMQYLTNENGLLKINRDSINAVIKAKTEQMALEAAESYVKRIINSTQEDAIESTDRLTLATDKLTQSTWAYLETQLFDLHQNGKLTDDQYAGALENLRNYRMILTGVNTEFQSHADEMTKANEAMDKILEYTIELVKQQVQDEIDGLNELVDQYKELIDAKKEALNQTKEEDDYTEDLLDKTKQLAKLKSEETMLRLAAGSGDRSAQAKLAKNLEEQGELQKDIDKTQRDHSIETQEEALDQMAEDYEEEKQEEIKVLEKSISSQQKLYDKAIAYIDEHWDTLYSDLITWNSEYGSTINDEITQNWVLATNALQAYKDAHAGLGSFTDVIRERNEDQYGTYDTTINEDGTSTVTQTSQTTNDTVASAKDFYSKQYFDARAAGDYKGMKDANDSMNEIRVKNGEDPQYSTYDIIHIAVEQMKENASSWTDGRDDLVADNEGIKDWLNDTYPDLGIYKAGGTWYLGDGRKLFEVYHTGGIVGGGMLRENEQMAIVQKGEPIISNAHKRELFDLVDFASVLSNRLGDIDPVGFDIVSSTRNERLVERLMEAGAGSAPSIQFGNVYIYGANDETVRKHEEVNRKFANEVLKYLNVKP